MPVQKLQSTDGFVVRDFADAPASGIVRRGRKILQRSATDLARSATYSFAFHEIERSGASAGLNAEGDDEGPALVALLTELHDELISGRLELLPAKGIDGAELNDAMASASQSEVGSGTDIAPDFNDRADLLTEGVVAATSWALGGIDGRRVFVEGDPSDPLHQAVAASVADAGATIVESAATEGQPWTVWTTDADAILVGSKPGAMNHQGAELLRVKAVVPWAPLPITTKALAVMIGRGITYVPDFVSASGPLVAAHVTDAEATSVADRVANELSNLGDHHEPLFVAACQRAEAFLATWQDKLPFGRPLAG